MNDLTAKLAWEGELKFIGVNGDGAETTIDGNRRAGAGPLELLLEALGAGSSTDVVDLLEKMHEPLMRLEIGLEANRRPTEPRYLTAVRVRFDFWGDGLNPERVKRVIGLSFAKYCSVYHTLRPDLELRAEFRLHDSRAEVVDEYEPVEVTTADEKRAPRT